MAWLVMQKFKKKEVAMKYINSHQGNSLPQYILVPLCHSSRSPLAVLINDLTQAIEHSTHFGSICNLGGHLQERVGLGGMWCTRDVQTMAWCDIWKIRPEIHLLWSPSGSQLWPHSGFTGKPNRIQRQLASVLVIWMIT